MKSIGTLLSTTQRKCRGLKRSFKYYFLKEKVNIAYFISVNLIILVFKNKIQRKIHKYKNNEPKIKKKHKKANEINHKEIEEAKENPDRVIYYST